MGTTAQTLWVCLLGYIVHIAAGSVIFSEEDIPDYTDNPRLFREFIKGGFSCYPQWQPWQAALYFNNSLVCTGALVHSQWVLTAAQCWNTSYTIGLGLRRFTKMYEPGVQLIEANYSVPHPEYTVRPKRNDLMLIKLSKPAVISNTVSFINIASSCPKPGTHCLASGWGLKLLGFYSDNQQCVPVQVPYPNTCRAACNYDHCSTFCIADLNNKETEETDAGSPIVCRGYLQGILSWRYTPDGKPGDPATYANLCVFKKWIRRTIRTA